jgi:hypothetical protein
MSAEEYCARVLSCLYKAAAAQIDNMCWLIDYADMNIDSYYKIASLFGIRMPECGSKELQEALSTYSKDISRTHEFQSDHELKQHRATELIRQFDEMFTRDHYAKLRGAMRDLIHIEPRIT